MDSSHYGNAMTEIALALAMAFFSLMVLTMVSMGAGNKVQSSTLVDVTNSHVTAAVSPATKTTADKATEMSTAEDQLLIFSAGRFLDAKLKPINPSSIEPQRRVILAIDPNLSLAEALRARAKLPTANLVVSTLTADWQAALKQLDAR